jgi:MYXO-CTERM domain-containing protein
MPAFAGGTWFEMGDAGQNGIGAAQIVWGTGNLNEINGIISDGNDVDVYQILITDFANFSAQTNGPLDTMLWLFNADGTGQVGNDDYPGIGVLSRITNQGVFSNGVYYIAVSRFFNRPMDASSTLVFGSAVWPGPDPQQFQPDPAAGAFTQWTGSGGDWGGYQIFFTGASFVPGPGAMVMLALAGIAGTRRRRH